VDECIQTRALAEKDALRAEVRRLKAEVARLRAETAARLAAVAGAGRDLVADRRACDAATGGAWYGVPRGDGRVVEVRCNVGGGMSWQVGLTKDMKHHDLMFAVLAREGWPAALELIARLQNIIDGMAARIAAQSDQLSRRAEKGEEDGGMPGVLPQWRLDMLRAEFEKRQRDGGAT
jgi:hypothetical protein